MCGDPTAIVMWNVAVREPSSLCHSRSWPLQGSFLYHPLSLMGLCAAFSTLFPSSVPLISRTSIFIRSLVDACDCNLTSFSSARGCLSVCIDSVAAFHFIPVMIAVRVFRTVLVCRLTQHHHKTGLVSFVLLSDKPEGQSIVFSAVKCKIG